MRVSVLSPNPDGLNRQLGRYWTDRRQPATRRSGGRTRTIGYLAATVVSAAIVAGCGDDSGSAPDPSRFTDRTFDSVSVAGRPIPGGGPLELRFTGTATEPTTLAANAGCNQHTGRVRFAGDTLTVDSLAATQMACPPPRSTADTWLQEFLSGPVTWNLDGADLRLSRDGNTVHLTERVASPLTGTRWRVTTLVSAAGASTSTALERAAPWLRIADDGSLSGSTGCNTIFGTATISGDRIYFGGPQTGKDVCSAERAEIERRVLEVLMRGVKYSIDGKQLRLTNGFDESLGLRLTAD